MENRPADQEFDHSLDVNIELAGQATPSAVKSLIGEMISEDEADITYKWGERGAETYSMPGFEVERYWADLSNISVNSVQPPGEYDSNNYKTRAPYEASKDFISTPLPNPNHIEIRDEIDTIISYDSTGELKMTVECETRFQKENADQEISTGAIQISYINQNYLKEDDLDQEKFLNKLNKIDNII